MSTASPAVTAMADATHAATQFSGRLYPKNWVCTSLSEAVSEAVRRALDDANEQWGLDFDFAQPFVLVPSVGFGKEVWPDSRRAFVDALARLRVPRLAACDTCSRGVAPVAGLLPVPAGAAVVVLALCSACFTFLACDAFPSAYFLPNGDLA